MRKLVAIVAVTAAGVLASVALAHGSGPSVEFVTPKPNATTGSTVTIIVKLDHWEIDAASVGKEPERGAGHLHFSMDEGKFDKPQYLGPAAARLVTKYKSAGKYTMAFSRLITYRNLPKGKHTIKVELAKHDHKSRGVEEELTFTVR